MATTWNQFMKNVRAKANAAGPAHVRTLTALAGHYARLGHQLGEERRRLGVSQDALATSTGVDQAEISRIEREVVDPRLTTFQKLLSGLGLELHVEPSSGRRLSSRLALRVAAKPKPTRPRYVRKR